MAETKAGPTRGGIHGSLGMVKVGGKASPESGSIHEAALLNLLGSEIDGPLGTRFRLVRLNYATGLVSASTADGIANPSSRRVMEYSTATGYDVQPGNAATDRPCGVTIVGQEVLADNDFFWVQIEGVCELYLSDDGTDLAAGDFVTLDNDSDLGKVITASSTFTHGVSPFRALEAKTGTDQAFKAQILHRLVG